MRTGTTRWRSRLRVRRKRRRADGTTRWRSRLRVRRKRRRADGDHSLALAATGEEKEGECGRGPLAGARGYGRGGRGGARTGTTRWRSGLRGRVGGAVQRVTEVRRVWIRARSKTRGSVEKSRQRARTRDALRERAFRRRRRRRLWRGPVRRRGEWRGRRGGREGRGSGHWSREVPAEWARGPRNGGWR